MSNRRTLVLGGIMAVFAAVGGLLLLRPGEPEKPGVVRVPAPAEAPTPAMSGSSVAALPSPSPAPTAEPGIDPPPPPQENGSPDYAKLGVQPAI